jgi:predicted nucleotide-binding protein
MNEKLIEELHSLIDSPESSITTILNKATRLASLSDDEPHRLLFVYHQYGLNKEQYKELSAYKPKGEKDKKAFPLICFSHDRQTNNNSVLLSSITGLRIQLQNVRKKINYLENQSMIFGSNPLKDSERDLEEVLFKIRGRVASFARKIEKESTKELKSNFPKNKVFIGHGRSQVWRDLKDFIKDRLDLNWDEFNRESTAGLATKERLEEMLQNAGFAFLIMTAEDEYVDQTLHARENVIHEIGLFQGKLGFRKAIVLLEEGCQEFSRSHLKNSLINFADGTT